MLMRLHSILIHLDAITQYASLFINFKDDNSGIKFSLQMIASVHVQMYTCDDYTIT